MKLFLDDETEEILRNVNVILETPKYSCPLNRDFGLEAVFIDAPTETAKAAIRAEIAEQIEKYEPRAKVTAISFVVDPEKDILKPKVTLEFRNA